jgi:hypothetical protein
MSSLLVMRIESVNVLVLHHIVGPNFNISEKGVKL